jgi:hypothetical protein
MTLIGKEWQLLSKSREEPYTLKLFNTAYKIRYD